MLIFTSHLEHPTRRSPHCTDYHSSSLRRRRFHDAHRRRIHISRDQDEMATYVSIHHILGQSGCDGPDRIRHASAHHKCCPRSLLCRRLWYRTTLRRRRIDFCRPDRGFGLLTGGLLPEHVVPGAQTRRSHTVDYRESRIHRVLYARCLCTLRKPLYSPIWSHRFYILRRCHGHRAWNRLL